MTHYDTSCVGGVGVCRRCRSDTMTHYDTAARCVKYDTRVRVSESVGECRRCRYDTVGGVGGVSEVCRRCVGGVSV